MLEAVISLICSVLVALIVVPLTFLFLPIAKLTSQYRIWSLDEVLAYILAFLVSKLPNYLSLLKKLEIGVFFFCWRSHLHARDTNALANFTIEALRLQALAEYSHAQVFCKLTGNKLYMSGAGMMDREEKKAFDWGCVKWDSSGESYQADGISSRYLSGKIFFWGQTANSYSWNDKLTFMCILEEFQAEFYKHLLKFIPENIQKELLPIIEDELEHTKMLNSILIFTQEDFYRNKLMFKWRLRKYLALIFLPIDAVSFLLKKEEGRRKKEEG